MSSEYFIDVNKLQEQADCFSREQNLCEQLYSQIRRVKNIHNPVYEYTYSTLLKKVRALADFYGNMNKAANTISDDTERILNEIGSRLEENISANQKMFHFITDYEFDR